MPHALLNQVANPQIDNGVQGEVQSALLARQFAPVRPPSPLPITITS